MKILNLYSGIGGNRKLWGNNHAVTAVEHNEAIAAVYQDLFPYDTVIIGDAHQYLLTHYKEYEGGFIWSSPPCPTHSNARFWSSKGGIYDVEYPDMRLYQEIIFLQKFFKGKYCVENVIPYYEPLISAQNIGRHLFWANFKINKIKVESNYIFNGADRAKVEQSLGFNLKKYSIKNKTKILRNCVAPEIGQAILNKVLEIETHNNIRQGSLFEKY
jgi:DNA (cytosine-5)-methyltransferase 1